MKVLLDSHGYFEERISVPFVAGLVGVFLSAGASFLTTLAVLFFAITSEETTISEVFADIGLTLFVYSFASVFAFWGAISLFFYIVLSIWGKPLDFLTTLAVAGLGFIPIAIISMVEFGLTVYFIANIPVGTIPTSTHLLIAGNFGNGIRIVVLILNLFMLLWACHIWTGALHQLGGLSPSSAVMTTLIVASGLAIELLYFGLL